MELTREQAFHSIYMGLAQLMTQEQFTEFKRNFMAMSDYEFQKVLAVLEYCDEHPLEISVKDLVAFRKEMKNAIMLQMKTVPCTAVLSHILVKIPTE